MLIPELCQLFPLPASLYAKCIALPSLFHRLRWFCYCIELRSKWREEIGVGINVQDNPHHAGQALLYDLQLKEQLIASQAKPSEKMEEDVNSSELAPVRLSSVAIVYGSAPKIHITSSSPAPAVSSPGEHMLCCLMQLKNRLMIKRKAIFELFILGLQNKKILCFTNVFWQIQQTLYSDVIFL